MYPFIFYLNMDENTFVYGSYNIDKGTLLHSLQNENNLSIYSQYKRYTPEQESDFRKLVQHLYSGVTNNTLSGTGFGEFTNTAQDIPESSDLYRDALDYVHRIANTIGNSKKKTTQTQEQPKSSSKFDVNKHGFIGYYLNSINPYNTTGDYTSDLNKHISSFEVNPSDLYTDFAKRLTNWQNHYSNFSNLDFSDRNETAESFNTKVDSLRVALADGKLTQEELRNARSLGLGNFIEKIFKPVNSSIQKTSSEEKTEEKNDKKEQTSTNIEINNSEKIEDKAKVLSDIRREIRNSVQSDVKNVYFDENSVKIPISEQASFDIAHYLDVKELAKELFRSGKYESVEDARKAAEEQLNKIQTNAQGGILKAQGGTNLYLNNSIPAGWEEFFEYVPKTGQIILKSGIDQAKFTEWQNANGIKYNAPVNNYGTNYTTPENPFTTTYAENTKAIGLKDANNNSRSNSLKIDSKSTTGITDLNSHVVKFNEDTRVNDIANFIQKGNYTSIDDALAAYNQAIDKLSTFKRGEHGNQYVTNDSVGEFNKLYNEVYNSHNINNIGYDESSINTNGSATMARGLDMGNVVELDLSKHETLSKLTNGKTLYKGADGRLYYTTEASITVPEQKQEGRTDIISGDVKPDNSTDVMPTKKEPYDTSRLLPTVTYLGSLYANKKMHELNAENKPLYYDMKEDHRWTYGNLRAMVAGKKQAAELANMTAKPMTSDGSLQLAAMFDAFNQGQKYISEGERIDDETLNQNLEKAWEQAVINHENRYNIAMKNRENAYQVNKENLLAKANWFRSNYESTHRFAAEMNALAERDRNEKKAYQDYYYKSGLKDYIERKPEDFVDNWSQAHTKLWNKAKSGVELNAQEQEDYNNLRNLVNQSYQRLLASEYGVYSNKPSTNWIAPAEPKFQIVTGRKGGRLEMAKTIIAYLKESNKNYNKAIDRSIRGLYNHIKEQKK